MMKKQEVQMMRFGTAGKRVFRVQGFRAWVYSLGFAGRFGFKVLVSLESRLLPFNGGPIFRDA